jgi:hypothetical protein
MITSKKRENAYRNIVNKAPTILFVSWDSRKEAFEIQHKFPLYFYTVCRLDTIAYNAITIDRRIHYQYRSA